MSWPPAQDSQSSNPLIETEQQTQKARGKNAKEQLRQQQDEENYLKQQKKWREEHKDNIEEDEQQSL